MFAVANFSYLYCRNTRYYLRLTLNQKQLWISLKTDSLDLAVHIRSQIKPLLANTLAISQLKANQLLKSIKHKISSELVENGSMVFQNRAGRYYQPTITI